MSNPFVQLLLRHAKQAGTVQIVQYITVDQLHELRAMLKTQQAVNGRSRFFGEYQFCHVYPVKGQRHVGKFVPANLVIGNADLNRQHGNQWLGGGEFISPAHRSVRWDIKPWMTDADIMSLMLDCIGRGVWAEFDKVAKLAPSQRHAYLEKLEALLDRNNPNHAAWLKVFDNRSTSTQDLRKLLEAVTGQDTFVLSNVHTMDPLSLLITETTRLLAYRPELAAVLKRLEQVEQASCYFREPLDLGEDEYFFFNILHGRDINPVVLESITGNLLERITCKVKDFDNNGLRYLLPSWMLPVAA
ncbi:hypothetical protein ACQKEN_04550 [Pseudomonas sp. NPDC078416]|uniref:hypothetical protein n=1 Tax=Pseudomonas sp. NPDC078416 TaxID=3390637 RepID=UPI003CFF4B10